MITKIKNLRCTDLLQMSIKQEPRRFRNNRSWFSLSDYQKVVNMCLYICMLYRIPFFVLTKQLQIYTLIKIANVTTTTTRDTNFFKKTILFVFINILY